jgi:alkaline phosphatase
MKEQRDHWRPDLRLVFGLCLVAVIFGGTLLLLNSSLAQTPPGIKGVPAARQPMGINLPAFRMDNPGVPIDEQIIGDLENLGAKWMRLEFRARGNPPALPIADYTTVLGRLGEHSIQALGLVDYTTVPWSRPSWGTTAYREEFVRTTVSLVQAFKDDVRYWEIWNEEDIGFGPGRPGGDTYMGPQDYAYLLGGDPTAAPGTSPWAAMGVYEAIKQADPGATVLLGGLSNAWKPDDGAGAGNYLLALYEELSALGYGPGSWPFDIVAVHPYYGNNPDPNVYLFNGGDYILRSNLWPVMDDYGDGRKRIWITEIGWNTNTTQWVCMPPFVSEENQAAFLETSWNIFLEEPTGGDRVLVDKVFWYQYQDTGVNVDPIQCPVATATPPAAVAPESYERVRPPRVTPIPDPAQPEAVSVVIDSWWGLVRGNYIPKPSYGAYRDHELPIYQVVLPLVSREYGPRARNVILLISDGWGYNHVAAASYYQFGDAAGQIYHEFPFHYAMSTYLDGGGYDPIQAWADFEYVKGGATDSAAAATAMSTGFKTYEGAIGVDPAQAPLLHSLELAETLGKSTGVVTSVEFSHATPAGFVAHNVDRRSVEEIAREMIYASAADVIMGAGNPCYNRDGVYNDCTNTYEYVGGEASWSDLVAGTAGGDADGDGDDDPWILIESRPAFQALMAGETPARVIGVAQVYQTLQQRRSGDNSDVVYGDPLVETVPTLEEMTRAALNILDSDPDGLFLMIESGAVDWASHANESGRMIEEQIAFDQAVQAVVDWVETNSSWEETLVIVSGDHECGYLNGPGSDPTWEPIVNNGVGALPGMAWYKTDHTNSLIPFFARGDAASLFVPWSDARDPVRGPYIDNTGIGRVVMAALAP